MFEIIGDKVLYFNVSIIIGKVNNLTIGKSYTVLDILESHGFILVIDDFNFINKMSKDLKYLFFS